MADKIDALIDEIHKLVRVVGENNASLLSGTKGSGNGRYSSGLFGYSNMLTGSKNTEELIKMFEATQKANAQTSSLFGRMFKDISHQRRDIEAMNIDLNKNIADYDKARKQLKETLKSSAESDSDLLKEAVKKTKELNESIEKSAKDLDKLSTKIEQTKSKFLNGKTDTEKGSINDILSRGKLTDKDKLELKGFNIDDTDIKEYSDTLDEIEKKQGEINRLKTDENKLSEETNKLAEKGNDALNKQIYQREQSFRMLNSSFSEIKRGFTDLYRVGKTFADAWMKVDTASSNFARNVGMGSVGMAALRQNTIGRIANTALSDKYGVGMEDLIKLQAGYTSAIGRNIGLSNTDQENAIAMNVVMGERGGQLAASLENFGLSYSDAARTAGKMFQDAGKYGLSFEKYSENFLQNIKIAQNYTFKNGLKGLESMAKKSTAIKLDMQQIAAFADKVGTLQGSVETAAKLQVLGGPFAQFSDPLGMLNESMTDMEGLMDRFTKMVGGLGRFDATNGQVAVSAFNKQRIRAAAEAMGMSYDQVMESVQAQGRRNYIESRLGGGWSDTEREFIMNTASVKNGTPTLSYIDTSGNRVEKNVSNMTKEELRIAREQNQSQTDDIKNIAFDTRQMAQQITGVQNKADAVRAKTFEKVHTTVEGGISLVNKNLKTIITILTVGQAVTALGSMVNGFGSAMNAIRGARAAGGAGGAGLLGSTTLGRTFNAGANGRTTGRGVAGAANRYGRRWASVGARTGRSAAGALGRSVGIGAGIGIGAEIIGQGGGYLIDKSNKDNIARGKYKEYSKEDINHRQGSAALKGAGHGAATGAMIGSLFGPLGTAIGAGVGALAGGAIGFFGEKKKIKEEKANIEKGEFELQNGNVTIVNGSINKDVDTVSKAKGGLLNGPSHSRGGMPILGSNIEVEGGEYVVNKHSASKNIGLLNAINQMGNGGIIKPRQLANGGMLTVLPTTDGAAVGNIERRGSRSEKQEISLTISGTIKLEGAGGKTVDITDEMLKDKNFIRKLTKLVEKQMIVNEKGGNVVKKGLY